MVSKTFDITIKETGLSEVEKKLNAIANASKKAQLGLSNLGKAIPATEINTANESVTRSTKRKTEEEKAYQRIISQTTGLLNRLTAQQNALKVALDNNAVSQGYVSLESERLSARLEKHINKLNGVVVSTQKTVTAKQELSREEIAYQKLLNETGGKLQALIDREKALEKAISLSTVPRTYATNELKKNNQEIDRHIDKLLGVDGQTKKTSATSNALGKNIEVLTSKQEKLEKAVWKGGMSWDEYEAKMRRVNSSSGVNLGAPTGGGSQNKVTQENSLLFQRESLVQKELDSLRAKTAGTTDALKAKQEALNTALSQGLITEGLHTLETQKLNAQMRSHQDTLNGVVLLTNKVKDTKQSLTQEEIAYNRIIEETEGELKRLTVQQEAYNKALKEGKISQEHFDKETKSLNQQMAVVSGRMGKVGGDINALGKHSKIARHEMVNMGYQLNDVFVSLASGQNPFTVLAQQGSQIGQILVTSEASFGDWTKKIGGWAVTLGRFIIKPWVALPLVASAAVALGFTSFFNAIQRSSKESLSFGNVVSGAFSAIGSGIHALANSWLGWDSAVKAAGNVFRSFGDYVMTNMPNISNAIRTEAEKIRRSFMQIQTDMINATTKAKALSDEAYSNTLIMQGKNAADINEKVGQKWEELLKEINKKGEAVPNEREKNLFFTRTAAAEIEALAKAQGRALSEEVDKLKSKISSGEKLEVIDIDKTLKDLKLADQATKNLFKETAKSNNVQAEARKSLERTRELDKAFDDKEKERYQEQGIASAYKNSQATLYAEIRSEQLATEMGITKQEYNQNSALRERLKVLGSQEYFDKKRADAEKEAEKKAGKTPKMSPMERAQQRAGFKYEDVIAELNREEQAYTKVGIAKEAQIKVNQVLGKFDERQLAMLRSKIPALEEEARKIIQQKRASEEVNKLYLEGAGRQEEYAVKKEALTKAFEKEYLATDKATNALIYHREMMKLDADEAENRLRRGGSSLSDINAIAKAEQQKAYDEARFNGLTRIKNEMASILGEEKAYQELLKNGMVTQEAYAQKMLELQSRRRGIRYDTGQGGLGDSLSGAVRNSFGGRAGFQELEGEFTSFFDNFKNGVADSLGRGIVYGEKLSDTLGNAARQGVSQLISGLAKLGMQWLFLKTIGGTLGSSADGGGLFSSLGSAIGLGGDEKKGQTLGAQNDNKQNSNPISGAIASINDATSTSLAGATDSFNSFFTGIAGQATTTFGGIQTQAATLGLTFEDIGMNALNTIVQGLVQVGLQWLIMETIGSAMQSSMVGSTAGAASAIASAWAPAAALASLATLGANAAPAIGGIAVTTAASMAVSKIGAVGFESGGYTGSGGKKQVAGVVHGQEFVVNAEATRKNRAVLEAMNSGREVSSVGGGGANSNRVPNVVVHNYGSSKIHAEVTRDEIRIIARDEVRKEAPPLVAKHISNPNSQISKSLSRNTKTQRRI